MARIFITGSSDGIGHHLARSLISAGHAVTLRARSPPRAQETLSATPGAAGILVGDLSSIALTEALAHEANISGPFDAVIHNAGVGYATGRQMTEDGLAIAFAVNVLASYVLTCLMEKPRRLVYLSSGLHRGGREDLVDVGWTDDGRDWDGMRAYSDSKLMDVLLAFSVTRHWPGVSSNAFSPVWVKTEMSGSGASGSIEKSCWAFGNACDWRPGGGWEWEVLCCELGK
ncbi:short-chain dehydrogenase/reductase SDR [Drepanopeziza brunnea f. sp. 'multigermtubi' MB_m1]|uniref:Short-chain dehydrogenase/reductase SDR n=1 Tax=Marssonina brunnea f. sp. multigermtubi (strain MB_m1) TaxID=1072389 RepID=K1X801_MARBU|nr:short-chain dehydrogenase/reductase SDR [Drepanopeziza brunnea f. sp. 'multigermtubi' MB_m1]EKD21192.1 short-chain dehydrogenase/reductase SDR [Drepanopeziza brunnea f. sp. 'multigermtubi' MB_m1]